MIRALIVIVMFYFFFFYAPYVRAQDECVNWGGVMWVSDEYDYRITFDSVGPARMVVFFANEDHDFVPLYETARLAFSHRIVLTGNEFHYWHLRELIIDKRIVSLSFSHNVEFEMIPFGKMHFMGVNGTLYIWPVVLL